jgi:hypothetical protein
MCPNVARLTLHLRMIVLGDDVYFAFLPVWKGLMSLWVPYSGFDGRSVSLCSGELMIVLGFSHM